MRRDDETETIDELLAEYGPPPPSEAKSKNFFDDMEEMVARGCQIIVSGVRDFADDLDALVAKNVITQERADATIAAYANLAEVEIRQLFQYLAARVTH